jgi:hypothetical protein
MVVEVQSISNGDSVPPTIGGEGSMPLESVTRRSLAGGVTC